MEQLIRIGEIVAPHGVRGEIRVASLSDAPNRFTGLKECYVQRAGEDAQRYDVLAVRAHKGQYVIKLAGVDDRDSAETLRRAFLVVPRSQVAPLPEGRYYVFELQGIPVYTGQEEPIGVVGDVISAPANDVLVVRQNNGTDALIPFVRAVVQEVDLERRRVVLSPWPGMLNDEGEPGGAS